jgi:hypothetical protein
MTNHLKTAEYFEGRAKRARHENDRVRFLTVAQRYRDKALERQDRATPLGQYPRRASLSMKPG